MMLSAKNINYNTVSYDSVRFISEEEFNKENKRTDLQVGDVLITIVGSIGRSVVISSDMPKFTLQRSVSVIKPSSNIIDSYFLNCVVKTSFVQSQLSSVAHGTSQQGLYIGDMKQIKIPLPPLAEQKKIIAKIEPFEKEIEEAKHFLNNAKNLKQDILDKHLMEINNE